MASNQTEDAIPRDIDLEQLFIGSLLRRNDLIDQAAAEMVVSHMSEPVHQRIVEMIFTLRAEGGAVTPELVASVLKRDPAPELMRNLEYFEAMRLAASAEPPIKDYVRHLRDMALRRQLIDLGSDMIAAAQEERAPQPIADGVMEQLLLLGRATARPVVSAFDLAWESLREVEAMQRGEIVPMVKTGIAPLDDHLGGLRGGDMIVIAGKSGMGKSALMGGIARNTSFAGVPTIVFSLEMMRRQWVDRMVCDVAFDDGESAIWYSKVRSGKLRDNEFDRFAAAAQRLYGLPFEIRDEDDVTIQQITAIARAFKAKHPGKIGIVFIDYLQIINPGDAREKSREQTVNSFARGVKALAKMLDWPVVVGSQMNEGAEGRSKEERRPQATDVRESKGIMNEADVILSPYREAYYVENRKPLGAIPGGVEWETWAAEMNAVRNRMDLLALKNRHGHKFDIELYCDMGASAIRDEKPGKGGALAKAAAANDAQGLLV